MLTADALKAGPVSFPEQEHQPVISSLQEDLENHLYGFGLRKRFANDNDDEELDDDDDICMKISDNMGAADLNCFMQNQQAAVTSTAEMTTPSKSISMLDITNLENKIKVLGKQIDTIKDKH
jgi:hypothetical protein